MFSGKIAVVTGTASGIGKCIMEEFTKNGAIVCGIDIMDNPYFVGDIADEAVLTAFFQKVIGEHGKIDYLINNAKPPFIGIDTCTYEQFNYALRVGVTAPFILSKLFAQYFNKQGAIINISSTRATMSQPQSESYTASKGALSALTHSMAMSLAPIRVNSISPGWIDTAYTVYEDANATQHPVGRVGNPLDIANMVLYLCSDKASFITAQDFVIDGGMTKQMIYHDDNSWSYDR